MAAKPAAPVLIYAVLDANVLLPPRLSDVIFDMQGAGLFQARWSAFIEGEFLKHWSDVVARDPHASEGVLKKGAEHRLNCYRGATREYEILAYDNQDILSAVPKKVDTGDIQVAATALKLRQVLSEESDGEESKVYLVTNNYKHLAAKDMAKLGVEVIKPGAFLDLFAEDARAAEAVKQAASQLAKPPYTLGELLGALQVHKSKKLVAHLSAAWGVQPTKRPGRKK